MAEAAAVVLTGEGHEGKEYAISNTENVSFHSVAEVLSQIAGKPITYTSPSADEYKSALTQAGVAAAYVDMFAAFAEAIKQGEFETNNSDLEKLLGRKPTTLAEYLKEVYTSN
jgi:NAD(P)H dehydrogenase (quinone)